MATTSLTGWDKITPRARSTDLEVGLAAEVADPLWLLCRQLQFGELTGDDSGTPVAVDVGTTWAPLTRLRRGAPGAAVEPIDHTLPLEAGVEREAALPLDPAAGEWTARVRAGRLLLRLLCLAEGLSGPRDRLMPGGDLAAAFTLPMGDAALLESDSELRYRRLLPQALDGAGLARSYDAGELVPMLGEGLDEAAHARLTTVLTTWRERIESTWGTTVSTTWQPERLEYRFSVAAPPLADGEEEVVLGATEYDGEGISWFTLDHDPGASLGAVDDAARRVSTVRTMLPTPLTFPGAAADRFWEMEDGAVALGAVDGGPTDLAKLLSLEFTLVYSPDWFLAPVEIPVGGVGRIDWIVVRDTFGHATLVGTHATQRRDLQGRQYQPGHIDGTDADVPLLVVLPSALGSVRSTPIEDVTLQRDEAANLAWGIERRVQGPSGRGVNRSWSRADFTLPAPSADSPSAYDLIWHLATPVAQTWIPYVAALGTTPDEPPVTARYLRRARLLDTTAEGTQLRVARSRLLGDARRIREEEVGRAGIRLTLTDQVARGLDGRVHAWRGRSKRPGTGEASSALSYDRTTRKDKEED